MTKKQMIIICIVFAFGVGFISFPVPSLFALLIAGVACVVFTINKIRSSNRMKWSGNGYPQTDKPKPKEKEGTEE